MKPEEQRIAIAETCGFKREERGYGSYTRIEDGEEFTYYSHDLPDYLNDLNAMHEAEKALSLKGRNNYIDWLGTTYYDSWEFCRATAAQRAEAFLRTIGKWEGDK